MGLGGLERPGAAGGQPSLRGGASPPWPGAREVDIRGESSRSG